MTQTLTTTEELKHLASSDNANELTRRLARELLANREAQPVMWVMSNDLTDEKIISTPAYPNKDEAEERTIGELTALYTAPPAPAELNGRTMEGWMAEALLQKKTVDDLRATMLAQPVSGGYKLPPHAYRELVNSLRDTAVKYSGTDQLLERLNTALSQFIEPDHPHTRTTEPDRN